MKVEQFVMERFQSEWENLVAHNLSESGVHPMSLGELLDPAEWDGLLQRRLCYVQTNGTPALREAIAALYPGATPDSIVVTNGTAEANYAVTWRLVEPGDEIVMMLPNYMQIWGVARGLGATVVEWRLREERAWAPDVDELDALVTDRTRMIAICNPNNPTGSILDEAAMRAIVKVASRHGTWILSDEVYRGAELDGRESREFLGALRPPARRVRTEQGLRLAGTAHRLGGRPCRDGGRTVGSQGLPEHRARRPCLTRWRRRPCETTCARASSRARGPSSTRTCRSSKTGSGVAQARSASCRRARAPSPTPATRGPRTPRDSWNGCATSRACWSCQAISSAWTGTFGLDWAMNQPTSRPASLAWIGCSTRSDPRQDSDERIHL